MNKPIRTIPLKTILLNVRDIFFPQWYDGENWTVKAYPDKKPINGSCFYDARRIELYKEFNPNGLVVILCHEISHALTRNHHSPEWFALMEQAYNTAVREGMEKVAEIMRHDIDAYRLTGI